MDNYIWIFGGGQLQKPAVLEAKLLGYKTIVTDKNLKCVCNKISDKFFPVDIFDIKENLKLAKKLKKKLNINAIFLCGIDCTVTAASVSKILNLNYPILSQAKITHNKFLFRKFQKRKKFFYPNFIKVELSDLKKKKLIKIYNNLSLPLIIKNVDSSASRGTFIFKEKPSFNVFKESVTEAIKSSKSKCGYCIIEDYFEGTEHTVETIYQNSKQFKCFITDRYFDHSNGYAIERGLLSPSKLNQKYQNRIFKLVDTYAKNLKIINGPLKADILLTSKGPMVIEMTVRLSGGYDCQYLVPSASGKNIIRAALQSLLNIKVEKYLLKDHKKKFSLSGSIWPKQGIIDKIKISDQIKKFKDYDHIFFTKGVGDKVRNYTNCAERVCFIICSSNSFASVKKKFNKTIKNIKIKIK